MSNEILEKLRKNEGYANALKLLGELSFGTTIEINKPFYVSIGMKRFGSSVEKIEKDLSGLEEMGLISLEGRKIKMKEKAFKYLKRP